MLKGAELLLVGFLDGNALSGGAVQACQDTLAGGLDDACAQVAQLLLHPETLMAEADDPGLADQLVVEADAVAEVHAHMHEHEVEGGPVDGHLQHMLQVVAPSVVEVVTLRPVVDMHEGVQVAHADLYGNGELESVSHDGIKKKKALKPSLFD